MKKLSRPGLRPFNSASGFYAATSLAVYVALTSCSGGSPAEQENGFHTSATGTFAYVEEVIFPDEIRAGEFLEFEVLVSMSRNVDKLYGTNPLGISSAGGYIRNEAGDVIGLGMDSSMKGPFTNPEPRYRYQRYTLPFEEGTYKLFILSADQRENGGLVTTVHFTPTYFIEPHPNLIVREFPFTVLPVENGEAE